jgi:hypothetical protein
LRAEVAAPVEFVPPMECKETDNLPSGEDWQYELKHPIAGAFVMGRTLLP